MSDDTLEYLRAQVKEAREEAERVRRKLLQAYEEIGGLKYMLNAADKRK